MNTEVKIFRVWSLQWCHLEDVIFCWYFCFSHFKTCSINIIAPSQKWWSYKLAHMQHLVAGALSLVLIEIEKIKIASFQFCASDREN